MQQEISIDNRQIISADYDTIESFCRTVICLVILLMMIFVSGYLFIYNALYISISKNIRYYGQLKTIGMTSRQLKRIIVLQALWNSLAGIPAGLAISLIVSKAAIPAMLGVINSTIPEEALDIATLWPFALSAVFAFAVNMISCIRPARIAGGCSPVEAMRYSGLSYSGRRRKREIGSPGSMALYNIFRDRKQAFVIFASFVIAISVFFAVNEVIRENNAKEILNSSSSYDIRFKNKTTLDDDRKQLITEKEISELREIPGVKEVRRVTSTSAVVPYQEEVYGEYYRELYKSRYSPGSYEDDMRIYMERPDTELFMARFISVDDGGFEVLNEELGNILDKEDFDKGKAAVAAKAFTDGDSGITGKTVRFYLPDGKYPSHENSIKISAVGGLEDNPAYFAGGYTPDLIVSESYAKSLMGDSLFTELVEVEYEEHFSAETEKHVKAVFEGNKQISHESKLERYRDMKETENQVKLLGGGLGLIIAVLAMLNYFNMMASSVQNRAGELAALESIGMTTKQIRRMLRLEGVGYAAISSCISLLIGIPVSYGIYTGMNPYRMPFAVPWLADAVLLMAVFAICMVTPVAIYTRTQGSSLIERLRKEE